MYATPNCNTQGSQVTESTAYSIHSATQRSNAEEHIHSGKYATGGGSHTRL